MMTISVLLRAVSSPRKFVNRLIEAVLQRVNKGRATSYGLKFVIYLGILTRIMIQGVGSSVYFGIVCPNERGLETSSQRFAKLNSGNIVDPVCCSTYCEL
jgi:hypothetical protein